ncbi:MAG: glycosyltransferase, partial [Gammaproteobacteria bacterium]|nr:glycosyltransferase [Gammaproteobacteria bacterium]
MKILHVLDHSIPLHSGYTFRTRSILREQRRRGWQTCHLTSTKQGQITAAEDEVDGLLFFRTGRQADWPYRVPVLNQYAVISDLRRRLRQVVLTEKPDIVHAHSPCLTGLAALPVCREFELPLVYEMRASWEDAAVSHGTTTEGSLRYRVTRGLETYLLRRADAITTICEGLRADIAARNIARDRITVIPNAVEAAQFTFGLSPDRALLEELGLNGKTVIGFIGSFYHYEGLHLLVDALGRLTDRLPQAHLLLTGGGQEDEALRQQVESSGLADRVTFTGRVPHADVPRYYSIVDILA